MEKIIIILINLYLFKVFSNWLFPLLIVKYDWLNPRVVVYSDWLIPRDVVYSDWLILRVVVYADWLIPRVVVYSNWLIPRVSGFLRLRPRVGGPDVDHSLDDQSGKISRNDRC